MTPVRVTTFALGGALLTAWLVVAATSTPSAPPPPSPPQDPPDSGALTSGLSAQAEGLRARLEAAPAPTPVGRNPFTFAPRFSERRRRVDEPVGAASIEPPAPVSEPAPALTLVAIATEGAARRAAITVGGEIMLVRTGDMVDGRYRVMAITADVVELEDAQGGPAVRLGLR